MHLAGKSRSASRSGKHWFFRPSTKEAYPSDTVSIELPSDAASASQSGKHWLFHPSTDEAYTNDATSIELPSDATWRAKVEITSAFKTRSIHPDSWHLFGVRWHRKFYFFVRLTFGCKAAPRFSDVSSEAVYWICQTITQSNPHKLF